MPTIDPNLGRLTWNPGIPQIGTYPITVVVTNSGGLQATQSYNLIVAADTQAPSVIIRTVPAGQVGMGQSFTVQVKATDNVGVTSLTLTATFGGVTTPIALEPDSTGGTATLSYPTAGLLTLNASAGDAAGNVGTASANLVVVDPSVTLAPVASIASPSDGTNLTAPVPVIGTVSDPSNALLSWTLSIAPNTDGELGDEGGTSPPINTTPTTIATGTTPIINGTLGTLDTTVLANGSYTLTLTDLNAGGLSSSIDVELSKNLKLGALNLSFTDMTVPAAGIPITITRNYSSLNANQQGDFGYGWTLSMSNTTVQVIHQDNDLSDFGDYVPMEDGDRVYVTLPDGTREGFTFEAQPDESIGPVVIDYTPAFIPDADARGDQLLVNTVDLTQVGNEFVNEATGDSYNPALPEFGNNYTLQQSDGTQLIINATTGQLASIVDRNGNSVTFTGMGIISSSGQSVQFTRDAAGRITAITSSGGRTDSYEYDSSGNLIAFTDPDGNTTQYTYLSTPAHYLSTIISPDGVQTEAIQYNSSGRVSSITNASGATANMTYNLGTKTQTTIDPLGNVTTTAYDDDGNPIEIVNPLGGTTQSTYDSNDDLLSQTVVDGQQRFTTTYTYDDLGDQTSETNAVGQTSYTTYDAFGDQTSSTDTAGQTTRWIYDSNGNLVTMINSAGQATVNNALNSAGLVTSTTDQNGVKVAAYTYNSAGQAVTQSDDEGVVNSFTYDANGDQTSLSYVSTNSNGSPSTVAVNYEYGADGLQTKATDPLGRFTETTYKGDGQPTLVTDARGNAERYTYDAEGRLIETQYADGTVQSTVYDALGRVSVAGDRHPVGATYGGTEYTYDALGDVIETETLQNIVIAIVNDPNNVDSQGNPLQMSELASAGTVEDATTSVYDQAGRLLSSTDAFGHTTSYEYDALGRQRSRRLSTRLMRRKNSASFVPSTTTNAPAGLVGTNGWTAILGAGSSVSLVPACEADSARSFEWFNPARIGS